MIWRVNERARESSRSPTLCYSMMRTCACPLQPKCLCSCCNHIGVPGTRQGQLAMASERPNKRSPVRVAQQWQRLTNYAKHSLLSWPRNPYSVRGRNLELGPGALAGQAVPDTEQRTNGDLKINSTGAFSSPGPALAVSFLHHRVNFMPLAVSFLHHSVFRITGVVFAPLIGITMPDRDSLTGQNRQASIAHTINPSSREVMTQ